jgi:hypothetical protein
MKTNIFISETTDHYSAGDYPKGLTTRPLSTVLFVLWGVYGRCLTVQSLNFLACCGGLLVQC